MAVKTCFFIGHRETTEGLRPYLDEAIEAHIKCGVSDFVVGNYGAFDRMVATALLAAQEKHPEIRLFLLIPYHPAERNTAVPKGFTSYYPPGIESVPRRFAIVRANRHMIDHSEYLIAYVWHPASNSRNLLEYAQTKNIRITNLADRFRGTANG